MTNEHDPPTGKTKPQMNTDKHDAATPQPKRLSPQRRGVRGEERRYAPLTDPASLTDYFFSILPPRSPRLCGEIFGGGAAGLLRVNRHHLFNRQSSILNFRIVPGANR